MHPAVSRESISCCLSKPPWASLCVLEGSLDRGGRLAAEGLAIDAIDLLDEDRLGGRAAAVSGEHAADVEVLFVLAGGSLIR